MSGQDHMTSTPAHGAPQSGDRPRASAGGLGLSEVGLTRVERCVCTGLIAAIDGDWADIGEAIRAHNAGPRHQAWRSRPAKPATKQPAPKWGVRRAG